MKRDGKSEEFLEVIQIHKGIIYKVANVYCKDEEDRKDLVQEIVFICGVLSNRMMILSVILPGFTGYH